MAFKNLHDVIAENHMSVNSVAEAIGMSESSLRYKINRGSMSVEEAFRIHRLIFPRYSIFYLFESVEQSDDSSENAS